MENEPRVVQVPFLDTGLGREADYANDERELRAEMESLLTQLTLARLDAIENEETRRFLDL